MADEFRALSEFMKLLITILYPWLSAVASVSAVPDSVISGVNKSSCPKKK